MGCILNGMFIGEIRNDRAGNKQNGYELDKTPYVNLLCFAIRRFPECDYPFSLSRKEFAASLTSGVSVRYWVSTILAYIRIYAQSSHSLDEAVISYLIRSILRIFYIWS